MNTDILTIFKSTGALLEGHFVLTSGRHSNQYFQCAKVLQYPEYAERLCLPIADHFRNQGVNLVVSPAVGGIVVGQEVARLLGVRHVFTERQNGEMTLRRGFEVSDQDVAIIAEDVITTGGSVNEVFDVLYNNRVKIKGIGSIVDRSNGTTQFRVPYFSLLKMEVITYISSVCPLCEAGTEAIKPGSRHLKS